MKKAPGRAFRKGLTLKQVVRKFPTDSAAAEWFVRRRWPDGIRCPSCGSQRVQTGAAHKTMPFRCREAGCDKRFSDKTGTLMERSKIGYQDWLLAVFLVCTHLKGVSSMKLHRDLGITQRSAWFLLHRLRDAEHGSLNPFLGPVEMDETYMGGKRRSMQKSKREALKSMRGAAGKTAIVGAKDRATKKVAAAVVRSADAATLHGFASEHIDPSAEVYTDEARVYETFPHKHPTVHHGQWEFARGNVHTNGIESVWALFKRAVPGTYHKMSPKHLHRYLREFVARCNMRELDTIEQIGQLAAGMVGRRLTFEELIAPNGLPSGSRGYAPTS